MRLFLKWQLALIAGLGRGRLVLLGVASVVLAVGLWALTVYWDEGPLSEERVVVIAPGASLTVIARQLQDAGVIVCWCYFVLWSKVLDLQTDLKAGEYAFPRAASLSSVIERIGLGRTLAYKLTVPEGLTNFQVVDLLRKAPHFAGEVTRLPSEGRLLPSTYRYHRGDTRQGIIERMEQAMEVELGRQWEEQSPVEGLGSAEEALVLASLIERETGVASERKRISGVFHNRLRRGMKLQSDPTLVYWESGKRGVLGRGLRRSELRRSHPYNTYLREGLPPTPIANPGRASIAAALAPQAVEDLYFVADGKGGHRFARTLRQHRLNVRLWRRFEAQNRKH